MTDQPDAPQLYLILPLGMPASALGPLLSRVLERFPVACLRIPSPGPGAEHEDELGRMADLVRDIAHAHDVAVVIDDHVQLALRHGLDGVHLTRGGRNLRAIRAELGADAIVGAYCGASRHDGLSAGEAGADYVSFGPCGASALGSGEPVPLDLFQWWSEIVEVPLVAEGALTPDRIAEIAPFADFIALGPEIWLADDPLARLAELWR